MEDKGFILGYSANIDRSRMGYQLLSLISVIIANHNQNAAAHFAKLIKNLQEVLKAHSLTGDMDYHIKVVTKDLKGLSHFANAVLLLHNTVQYSAAR